MAIEWEVRINRPVTVGAAVRLTADRLATLLAVPADTFEVIERLRVSDPAVTDLAAAIQAVLVKTRLRRDY
jgi:hypothetical protein